MQITISSSSTAKRNAKQVVQLLMSFKEEARRVQVRRGREPINASFLVYMCPKDERCTDGGTFLHSERIWIFKSIQLCQIMSCWR